MPVNLSVEDIARWKEEIALREALAKAETAETSALKEKLDLATAESTRYSSFVPDLSKVQPGSLEMGTGAPLFAEVIAYRALETAATDVVDGVAKAIGSDGAPRILVTTDTSISSSDAVYVEMTRQLKSLTDAAEQLLTELGDAPGATKVEPFVGPVLAGAASLVPGVLSLLSAHRSLTSATIEIEGAAACASVIGRAKETYPDWILASDGIRLLPVEGGLQEQFAKLSEQRERLVARSFKAEKDSQQAGQLAAAIAGIDQFVAAAMAVPSGGSTSPYMTALLREQLHGEGKDSFTHVLVLAVKAGGAQGVTDDRPLWGKDRFTTTGAVAVSYFLLDAAERTLLAADTAVGTATKSGKIGDDGLTLTPDS